MGSRESRRGTDRSFSVAVARSRSGGHPIYAAHLQPSDQILNSCASLLSALAVALAAIATPGVAVQAGQPPASLYRWEPVRLGAGGFVTGFVTHPLDASIRYCRTDVGNAYRWDGHEWRPLLVREGGRGMPEALAATPVSCGVDSIAVDPSNKHVVLLTMNAARPEMLKSDRLPSGGNVYRSPDGGITFTAGNLSLSLEPNGPWRTEGERLKVDPNNGQVVFYGSLKEGLWRSQDGGMGWNIVQGHGAPDRLGPCARRALRRQGGHRPTRRPEVFPHDLRRHAQEVCTHEL